MNESRIGTLVLGLTLAVAAAGCTAGAGPAASGPVSPGPGSPGPTGAPSSPSSAAPSFAVGPEPVPSAAASIPAPVIGLPASLIDPVVAAAARVAGVPPEQVTVVYAMPQTFPDGGLGCPEPGMLYTQVMLDGYRIVVEIGGTQLDYRGTGDSFRRCDHSGSPGAS